MKIPQNCDIVVIGGGPAGSMAATFLSQKGYHVVLLERQKHPRPHVGENLIPHFWKYTDLAKVTEQIIKENFIQKAGGTVAWHGMIRQVNFKDFGYSRSALHVERDIFDQILLKNAQSQGAEIYEEVNVTEVELKGEGEKQTVIYRCFEDKSKGSISCRFIVDASGQGAVIAKQLGLRTVDESFRFMSLWGYFKNSKYIGCDGKAHSYENIRTTLPVTFQSAIPDVGKWGWAWHIPLRENTSVGLILPIEVMKTAKSPQESWEAYFLRKCGDIPILNQLLENAQFCHGSFAKIQDYSYRMNQVTGAGFFLIGDAAGFIDPIFSIGVILGMYSGYIASWAIDRSLKQPSSTRENQALFSSQLQGRYEVSRSLALPRYQSVSQASDGAKTTIKFEKSLEQELMLTVSQMSTRSDNFLEMVETSTKNSFNSHKLKTLETISF